MDRLHRAHGQSDHRKGGCEDPLTPFLGLQLAVKTYAVDATLTNTYPCRRRTRVPRHVAKKLSGNRAPTVAIGCHVRAALRVS